MIVCPTCLGGKYIPFLKEGRIIANAFLECPDCYKEPQNTYLPLTPDMLDFPVSRDFYRFYASHNHWPDPGPMVEQQAPARELVQLRTVINNYNARPSQFKMKGDDRKSDSRGGVSL